MRSSGHRVVAMLATGAVALAAAPPAARQVLPTAVCPGAGSNPIAHMAWGAPRNDDPWNAYESATGANKDAAGSDRGAAAGGVARVVDGRPARYAHRRLKRSRWRRTGTRTCSPSSRRTTVPVGDNAAQRVRPAEPQWILECSQRRDLVSQHGGGDRQRAGVGGRADRPAVRAEDPLDRTRTDRHLCRQAC